MISIDILKYLNIHRGFLRDCESLSETCLRQDIIGSLTGLTELVRLKEEHIYFN